MKAHCKGGVRADGVSLLIVAAGERERLFSSFSHKQRKQRHYLKLGKKRRESSKRNYYIISPRVIIKAIIIIIG